MSQSIKRLKADVQSKRRLYNALRKNPKVRQGMVQRAKTAYNRALAKLKAARAARAAQETESETESSTSTRTSGGTVSAMIQAGSAPSYVPSAQPAVFPAQPFPFAYGPARRRFWSRMRFRRRMMGLQQSGPPQSFLDATSRQDDLGALAFELGALEAELDAIHADMHGVHYGDLGADGRGATAAGATAAGAAGGATALTVIGGGSLTAGASSTAALVGGSVAAGGLAAGAVALAPVAAAIAVPVAGYSWLASWRASTKNVARLQAKIRRLRQDMKVKVASARSSGKKRRLKRRYQRRIDRAKNRLDRIKRVMRRRILRAKKRGKMDKVKKLRAMRRAAQYGRGRKKMLARKKRRAAKRARSQGENVEAAALEAEVAQIEALPDEAFVTEQDYELDPELASQLGPAALSVQQWRASQGLPPTVTQESLDFSRAQNALLRARRQEATGYNDDDLLTETESDYLDFGAATFFRNEEGKIRPAVLVGGVALLAYALKRRG